MAMVTDGQVVKVSIKVSGVAYEEMALVASTRLERKLFAPSVEWVEICLSDRRIWVPSDRLQAHGWLVVDKIVSPEVLSEALARADAAEARRLADAELLYAQYERQRKTLTHNLEGHGLRLAGETRRDGADLALANIALELSKTYKGTTFQVKKRHGNVVVTWTDGPIESEVERRMLKYRRGNSVVADLIGGAQSVFVSRMESDTAIARSIQAVVSAYPDLASLPRTPTPADYREGRLWETAIEGSRFCLQEAVHFASRCWDGSANTFRVHGAAREILGSM